MLQFDSYCSLFVFFFVVQIPFGYTRKDVILIGVGITVLGVGLKYGLEVLSLFFKLLILSFVSYHKSKRVLNCYVVVMYDAGVRRGFSESWQRCANHNGSWSHHRLDRQLCFPSFK